MATWIKWVKGLAKRPEVLQMATLMRRTRHDVAGLLCEFWEWADENVIPQNESAECPGFVRIQSASNAIVDMLAGADGFAEAMTAVGWLIVRDGALEFPKFGRHNGKSAKQRALDAERKRSKRDDNPDDVRNMSGSKPDKSRTREEKRREDNTSSLRSDVNTPKPPTNDVQSEWVERIYRAYPKHVAPKPAKLAIRKAFAFVEPAKLLEIVEEYAICRKLPGQDPQMTPFPATWFNGGRWNDDRAVWRIIDIGAKGTTGQPRATQRTKEDPNEFDKRVIRQTIEAMGGLFDDHVSE